MSTLTCIETCKSRKLPPSVVIGLFLICSCWRIDSDKSAFNFLSLFKRNKKPAIKAGSSVKENGARTNLSSSDSINHNSNDRRSCNALGVKRNCELPPVPVTNATPSNTVESRQTGDMVDGTRPYSFCEPSESDPLYASVGLPAAAAAVAHRSRPPEVPPPTVKMTDYWGALAASTATGPAATAAASTAAAAAAATTGGESEDSGGSAALPYYSSIRQESSNPNNRSSSPCYQEAPVVYAQVKANNPLTRAVMLRTNRVAAFVSAANGGPALRNLRRAVKSQGNQEQSVQGPPVPSRAYRLSEIEHLLNANRSSLLSSSSSVTSTSNAANTSGRLNIMEVLSAGLGRRRNNDSTAERVEVPVLDALPPPASRGSSREGERGGDYSAGGGGGGGGSGSGGSNHYRSITVRESIASLRARNALPTFLTDANPPLPLPSETDYEGVYWYPEETNEETARRDTTDASRSSQYGDGLASTDVGSDAYVEIPDGAVTATRREEIYAEPQTEESRGQRDSVGGGRQASPNSIVSSRATTSSNVSRILAEMQDFRYVDSETDLSSSVTPPQELVADAVVAKRAAAMATYPAKVASQNEPPPPPPPPPVPQPCSSRLCGHKTVNNMTPVMERSLESEGVSSFGSRPQPPPPPPPPPILFVRTNSRPLPQVITTSEYQL